MCESCHSSASPSLVFTGLWQLFHQQSVSLSSRQEALRQYKGENSKLSLILQPKLILVCSLNLQLHHLKTSLKCYMSKKQNLTYIHHYIIELKMLLNPLTSRPSISDSFIMLLHKGVARD